VPVCFGGKVQLGRVVPQASAGAAELAAAQARSLGQLQALESQLASKDAALDASQMRLAALEVELKGAHSKVRVTVTLLRRWSNISHFHAGAVARCCTSSTFLLTRGLHDWVADERAVCWRVLPSQTAQLQRQMQLAESELSHMAEAQAEAGQHVAALQAELAAAHDQAAAAGSALEAAARDASQARCLGGCAGVHDQCTLCLLRLCSTHSTTTSVSGDGSLAARNQPGQRG
jgi:hypothetical protein